MVLVKFIKFCLIDYRFCRVSTWRLSRRCTQLYPAGWWSTRYCWVGFCVVFIDLVYNSQFTFSQVLLVMVKLPVLLNNALVEAHPPSISWMICSLVMKMKKCRLMMIMLMRRRITVSPLMLLSEAIVDSMLAFWVGCSHKHR